ncbi:MAG: 5-formyltetrahydrofolate cyclo-ligase [Rickettsiales endosymbiont of Dermacentor nuttalli]
MNNKTFLRSYYRQLRTLCNVNDPKLLQQIFDNFLNTLENFPKQSIIAGYLAMPDELDLLPLLQKSEQYGYKIAMPVVTNKNSTLSFRLCGANPRVTMNKYYKTLPEPADHYPYIIPNIIITPLLVCDRDGIRLGYGGGFYDKTLSLLREQATPVTAIGICHHNLLVNIPLPREPFDQVLDIIITDQEVITIRD